MLNNNRLLVLFSMCVCVWVFVCTVHSTSEIMLWWWRQVSISTLCVCGFFFSSFVLLIFFVYNAKDVLLGAVHFCRFFIPVHLLPIVHQHIFKLSFTFCAFRSFFGSRGNVTVFTSGMILLSQLKLYYTSFRNKQRSLLRVEKTFLLLSSS